MHRVVSIHSGHERQYRSVLISKSITYSIQTPYTRRQSCARAADAASESMLASTGTRSTEPCVAITAFSSSTDTHPTCRTKSRERPGRTNACVTSRASPFPITPLQPLHFALPVGASPIEKVCGRVLKWYGFMLARDRCLASRQRALHSAAHQSLGSTSAAWRYAVTISGSAIAAVSPSSEAV